MKKVMTILLAVGVMAMGPVLAEDEYCGVPPAPDWEEELAAEAEMEISGPSYRPGEPVHKESEPIRTAPQTFDFCIIAGAAALVSGLGCAITKKSCH